MLNWIVLNRTAYLYKMDLAWDNQQRLIYHKTQQTKPNQTKPYRNVYTPPIYDSVPQIYYTSIFIK